MSGNPTALSGGSSATPGRVPGRATGTSTTLHTVVQTRRRGGRRRRVVIITLSVLLAAVAATSLMAGQSFYPPDQVIGVILGHDVPGASFTVGRLRLPRTSL
ncbi:MAG: hypothetical protein ACTJHU_11930, partial [Mycetocola sp.]